MFFERFVNGLLVGRVAIFRLYIIINLLTLTTR